MHLHENWVVEDFIGEIQPENVAEQTEAVAHSAVLSTKGVISGKVEHDIVLAQLGLSREAFDVVLSVLNETARGGRTRVGEEALLETVEVSGKVSKLSCGTKGVAYSLVIAHRVVPSS